jgi:hypothetical protein
VDTHNISALEMDESGAPDKEKENTTFGFISSLSLNVVLLK